MRDFLKFSLRYGKIYDKIKKYVEVFNMIKEYSTPVLNVISMGQTDVICTSNYESKDVTKDDTGLWED